MPKNATKNDDNYESRLALAIDALKNKKIPSLRRAAHVFDVSVTTLRMRIKGRSERARTRPNCSILTAPEEISLREWILSMESRGCPVRPSMIRTMANLLLSKREETPTPVTVGRNWVSNYLRRQTDLKSRFLRKYNYKRAQYEDPVLITEYFDYLHKIEELNRQSATIKRTQREVSSMPPSPTKHLFDCLIKGYTTALQLNAILLKERYDLRVAIHRQKTKRTIKGRVLNMPGVMGVSEAQEITAAALAHPEASQIPNLEAIEGRRRALPTCSNCKLVGHLRTYCPTRPT